MKKAMVLISVLLLLGVGLVMVSEDSEAAVATVSSITVHLTYTDETDSDKINEYTATAFKAQLVFSGTGDKEGLSVNMTMKKRNATVPYSWTIMKSITVPTDENGTVYWNAMLWNMTYPTVTGVGSQYFSLNTSYGSGASAKYNNQSFILYSADNVTVYIDAPDYVAMDSLFRPFIQAYSREMRYDPNGANVTIKVIHWNYAGTNTTVKSINTQFNSEGWVQPAIYLNDSNYNEGYYELFVGLLNHTHSSYANSDYSDQEGYSSWWYHRAWHGFRIVYGVEADAGADKSVQISTNTSLSASVSVGDILTTGGALNYTWTKVSGPSVTIVAPYTATPYFTPTTVGLYRFRINITNGYGQYDYDYVAVRVYDTKLSLAKGWNLVAYPLTTATAASTITGKSTLVTTIVGRTSAGAYKTYDQAAGITDFNVGEDDGIWIYTTSAVTITL